MTFFVHRVFVSCQELLPLQGKIGLYLQHFFGLSPGFIDLAEPCVSLGQIETCEKGADLTFTASIEQKLACPDCLRVTPRREDGVIRILFREFTTPI
jgi:hypothetical protein